MDERLLKNTLLNAQAEALVARIVLDELRGGRMANALELLEQKIDSCVLIIARLTQKLGTAAPEDVAPTLRVLLDYRQRHPRKREATFEGLDEPALQQTQQRVREILQGTK
jgi:hypothetical protein